MVNGGRQAGVATNPNLLHFCCRQGGVLLLVPFFSVTVGVKVKVGGQMSNGGRQTGVAKIRTCSIFVDARAELHFWRHLLCDFGVKIKVGGQLKG